MSPDLTRILRIQSLDLTTIELEREIAALPKHVAQIEKQLDSHKRRLEADRAALAANQRERKSLDVDIQAQNQKISKLRDQMVSAKTNEQYRVFQHEIEFCEKEIRRFEDRQLDLMSESEPLEANVKKAELSLAAEAKQVEAEKKAAVDRTALDKKKLAEIHAERDEHSKAVKPAIYNNYERVRKRQTNGMAMAEASSEGRCTACSILIRPQVMSELRQSLDELKYCENCRRILFVNPPVSVEG